MLPFKKLRYLLVGAGLLIVLSMFVVELLPNSSPGFGPLQTIGVVVGLVIVVLSQAKASILGTITLVIVSILVTTLVLEVIIGFQGYDADYTSAMIAQSQKPLELAPYWACDSEFGCRFIADGVLEGMCPDSPTDNISRTCIINSQGYHDLDEFTVSPELRQSNYRVMLLGDSFTFGANADYPKSFADLLTEHMSKEHNGIVWNFGIPGTATRQALALAKEYVPTMQPDIVLLGFFNNDFNENLYPLDFHVNLLIDDKYVFVNAYRLDRNFVPHRLDANNIYFRAVGQPASYNQLEVWLRLTRLGSLGLNALSSLNRNPDENWNVSVHQTRNLLQELKTYLDAENVPLVVLNIPSIDDIQGPTRAYATIRQISADLELPVLEVLDRLTLDDYLPLPNGHWNNSGHAKASEVILACVDFMVANPNTICPDAVN